MKTLDAKGLKCPMPLIETKKALKDLDKDESLKIIIDNETSVKNVNHYLHDNNIPSTTHQNGNLWEINVTRGEEDIEKTVPEAYCAPSGPTDTSYVIMLAKDRLGEGSDELGNALVGALLNSALAQDVLPQKIIFMNSGINLVTKGSLFLHLLKELESRGVDIISCGTCLDYFGKMDELIVGRVTNMHEILESMLNVSKVINI
ncbi:MAG: sulfurtransferase-like selenium metabolism protein YedF [Bacteroidales bacterium]|nr:sulfurtransferase-like selenium metabolism protein YedF [Bacteroidales bacterium]